MTLPTCFSPVPIRKFAIFRQECKLAFIGSPQKRVKFDTSVQLFAIWIHLFVQPICLIIKAHQKPSSSSDLTLLYFKSIKIFNNCSNLLARMFKSPTLITNNLPPHLQLVHEELLKDKIFRFNFLSFFLKFVYCIINSF